MDDGLEVDVLDELRKEYVNNDEGSQRYVTFHACGKYATIADGRKQSDCDFCKTFELGPEVKSPDYGPLLEWHVKYGDAGHHKACSLPIGIPRCTCGLTDALKAAGL